MDPDSSLLGGCGTWQQQSFRDVCTSWFRDVEWHLNTDVTVFEVGPEIGLYASTSGCHLLEPAGQSLKKVCQLFGSLSDGSLNRWEEGLGCGCSSVAWIIEWHCTSSHVTSCTVAGKTSYFVEELDLSKKIAWESQGRNASILRSWWFNDWADKWLMQRPIWEQLHHALWLRWVIPRDSRKIEYYTECRARLSRYFRPQTRNAVMTLHSLVQRHTQSIPKL